MVTESVFSMDGDHAPLKEIGQLCEKYNAALIVDEAHATGIIGSKGEGLVQKLHLQKKCFARIHTFGKACGAHGAIILGSEKLKNTSSIFQGNLFTVLLCHPFPCKQLKFLTNYFHTWTEARDQLHQFISTFQNAVSKF